MILSGKYREVTFNFLNASVQIVSLPLCSRLLEKKCESGAKEAKLCGFIGIVQLISENIDHCSIRRITVVYLHIPSNFSQKEFVDAQLFNSTTPTQSNLTIVCQALE